MAKVARVTSMDRIRSLANALRTPTKMTVASVGGMLLVSILAGYMPADSAMMQARKELFKAEKRAALGDDLRRLRGEARLYKERVAIGIDQTEWTAYLNSGVLETGGRLVFVEPKQEVKLGPCTSLAWGLEVEGTFQELCAYVAWIERGDRLMRIDRMVFEARNEKLLMALTVRGLVRQ